MGIMTRLTRICKADLHGVMDQIEDKDLVLKQCLREMETSLAQKQEQLARMTASAAQVKDSTLKLQHERETIEQDIQVALEKEKDAIARMLIRKLKAVEQQRDALNEHGRKLERDIAGMQTVLEAQRQEYERIQLRSETHFQKTEGRKWEETVSRVFPEGAWAACSEEEIELELIKRKENLKGGA